MFLCAHTTSSLALLLLLLLLPLSLSFYIPDSNPVLSLNDQVRERHLYTENQRKELFVEMRSDGSVAGSPVQSLNSVLELRSVQPGETVIRGVASSLYLCVDSAGQLRGQARYSETDCTFRELLLADGYTRFLSTHHRLPLSLASRRSPGQLPLTRFLPLRNNLSPGEEGQEALSQNQNRLDLNSADPLGMVLTSMFSPQFSMDQ